MKGKTKKISHQLLVVIIPMIALFIVAVAVMVLTNASNNIQRQARETLSKESSANANDIGSIMKNIAGYYNGLADTIEVSPYQDDKEILHAMLPGMEEYKDTVSDVYIGFSDKGFIDASGWVPDKDYDPTTRGWYETGKNSTEIIYGAPSMDMTTNQMVVCGSRSVKLLDKRDGVMSVDVVLAGISQSVSGYKPLGTGQSMLLSGSVIVGHPDDSYVGTDVGDHGDDALLQAIYTGISGGKEAVVNVKGYYASYTNVTGTDWILVSYVKESDVLAGVKKLTVLTILIVLIALIASTLVIMIFVKRCITVPVTELTQTIIGIADGDFTLDVNKGGDNEIGVMNNRMGDYIVRMRDSLINMKDEAGSLSGGADDSRQASEVLNSRAQEQSRSMAQIREAMNGVAQSVTELATNATELAQAVGDMTDQGASTNETMNELVKKAKKGQRDMDNVQKNMMGISSSMDEMNEVVSKVGDATMQINSIIDMINSISSQTNLLSLNASIEAARAGEAGKGFAVVANEIGKLAGESAEATTEIANIIGEVTKQINDLSERSQVSIEEIAASSEAVNETGKTFEEIFSALDEAGNTINSMITQMDKVNEIATSVAAIAEEQSASTEEVTATVDTAAESARDVADESGKVENIAEEVSSSADTISHLVSAFVLE